VTNFFTLIFYVSILLLTIISVYPGSLIGFLIYNDFSQQPNFFKSPYNPYGTAVNHFVSYLYVSLLGLFLHLKKRDFNKTLYRLLFLSVILELLHLIIPNRSFEKVDLIFNISGVMVAYLLTKIYLFINKL